MYSPRQLLNQEPNVIREAIVVTLATLVKGSEAASGEEDLMATTEGQEVPVDVIEVRCPTIAR